jgi:hypothetical protein
MRALLWSLGLLTCMALMGIQPTFATPSLSTSTASSASSLPLDGEGNATTHVVKVATISLSTDNSKGFTVTISSSNLTKVSQETPISYRVMTVISGANPPSSGDFTVAAGNNYTFVTTQAGSQNRDLYILYTPANFQDPGTYSANIAILIADNP